LRREPETRGRSSKDPGRSLPPSTKGREGLVVPPRDTAIGSLIHYLVSDALVNGGPRQDVWRWNRITKRQVTVHIDDTFIWAVGLSTDGRYEALVGGHMFRADLTAHTIQRFDPAGKGVLPYPPAFITSSPAHPSALLSGDGRYGLFTSRDSSLVPADTNHAADVFLAGPLPWRGGSL